MYQSGPSCSNFSMGQTRRPGKSSMPSIIGGGLSSQAQHFFIGNFIRCLPPKTFSWTEIEDCNKPVNIFVGKRRYFTSLRNKLADANPHKVFFDPDFIKFD